MQKSIKEYNMNTLINGFCKNEGITTVKAFRSFFEYYIIGWGELDDDFSPATKRIAKNRTVAQWKKWYTEVTDKEITENLATEETESQMRDAGLEYDPSKTWEENIKENAVNAEIKIDEIKKYSGYGYHGGGRKAGTAEKTANLNIRCKPEELEKIKRNARDAGMTMSEYICKRCAE